MKKNQSICYLCGKELDDEISSDHIIPDHLFNKGDPHRPQLPVHKNCNGEKSLEDEWFIKLLQIYCSLNPQIEKDFIKFMDLAIAEKDDAFIIGKKVRNFVLAKKIFQGTSWGLEIRDKGKELMQFKMGEDGDRFNSYLKTLCKGLFIYNVKGSKPTDPDLIVKQYALLDLKEKKDVFIESIKQFYDASGDGVFGQYWGPNRILYFGSRTVESPNQGFIFIEFFGELGVLAEFR